nr:hypothetical protein [Tanacetum cinerariifolium]
MVWVFFDLPPNCKTVGSKWIFKKKTDMDGIVHIYKARLVAKGYTQLYGGDYEETLSPITNIRVIRILISIMAFYDYEIWKMDVKNSFLNVYLDEDIYMVQLEGLLILIIPGKYAIFKDPFMVFSKHQEARIKDLMRKSKSLVLLKILMSHVYIKRLVGVMLHSLYVDDIIIMGHHIPSLQSIKDYLGKCFAMKDLGEATFIIGIKIYRDRSKRLIRLGQNASMDKILKRYKMDNSKGDHMPMQERLDLNKTQGASTPKEVKRMQNVPYALAMGSIMHVTGYVFILKGGTVGWKISKQSTIAMSATEAEYISALEVVWIRKFISGLGIESTINEHIRMFCNNSAALYFANKPGVQRGAKHYHRRYHYVRESIALGEIRFLKVHTDDNLADPFTKALSSTKLTQHAMSIGLRLASSFM